MCFLFVIVSIRYSAFKSLLLNCAYLFPIDSFELVWSALDGTNIEDHQYKAGDIVLERNRDVKDTTLDAIYKGIWGKTGHIEAIMEDGSTAVYTAGGETQWQNYGKDSNGEYISYTRKDNHVYVIRIKVE
jgi:hypothetical protein